MNNIEHTRWCITQCPCFSAELTIWWFLTGSKHWNVYKANVEYNYIGAQIETKRRISSKST